MNEEVTCVGCGTVKIMSNQGGFLVCGHCDGMPLHHGQHKDCALCVTLFDKSTDVSRYGF